MIVRHSDPLLDLALLTNKVSAGLLFGKIIENNTFSVTLTSVITVTSVSSVNKSPNLHYLYDATRAQSSQILRLFGNST